jgi:hypothetical protein
MTTKKIRRRELERRLRRFEPVHDYWIRYGGPDRRFEEDYLETYEGFVPVAEITLIKKENDAWWTLVNGRFVQVGSEHGDDWPTMDTLAICTATAVPAQPGDWVHRATIDAATGEIRHEQLPVVAWLQDENAVVGALMPTSDGTEVIALEVRFPSVVAEPLPAHVWGEGQFALPFAMRSASEGCGFHIWDLEDIERRLRQESTDADDE